MSEDFAFNKINFNRQREPQIKKRKPAKSYKFFRPLLLFFGLILAILLSLSLAIFVPARKLIKDIKKARTTAASLYEAGKNQDIDQVQKTIKDLKGDLNLVEADVNSLNWVGLIPFIGSYQKDAGHLVVGAKFALEAGEETVNTVAPYTDLLGLKGQSKFVAGSADERIKTAVETLDKVVPNIDKIAGKLKSANSEINAVDFNRYPQNIGSLQVRQNLVAGKKLFEDTTALFVNAQPLLKKLPDLLGVKEGKKYLLLFQNDAELRATGGFLTAFAIFNLDKGKMTVERSDDIYKLDEAKKKQFKAPEKILTYHKNVPYYQLRDSNLSPDFLVSMKDFEKLLKDSDVDLGDYEGIIALDTHVLVSAIKILGEFNVAGRSFSADVDKRCDCPKAIYELEDYSTRPVAYVRTDRKGIIGDLLYQIMQRALGVSPSQYWGKLFQMFLDEAGQKHVLFYFHDTQAQKGIEALNFGGRIKEFNGDYLHINNVNFAGAKSNLFVTEEVERQLTDKNGVKEATLTITYKNPAPASNCNLEAGQLCLNGILRNWLRVYVPAGSSLVSFNGSEMETQVYQDLGKTVFEGFLTVKPEGSAKVEIVYKLPDKIPSGKDYQLLIQKQPGTDGQKYKVGYNGRQKEIILDTDSKLQFN